MTSWHKHSSSLRHERSGRKWPQSERRWKKEQLSQQCKADYQQNGGIAGWNARVICGTCITKWPVARQHPRTGLANNLTDHQDFVDHWVSTSVLKGNAERKILWLCATCGFVRNKPWLTHHSHLFSTVSVHSLLLSAPIICASTTTAPMLLHGSSHIEKGHLLYKCAFDIIICLSGFDDNRSWRFARIRSFRNLRQKIQQPRIIRKGRIRMSVCIPFFFWRFLNRPIIPSSIVEGNILQDDDVEIEGRWQQEKHNRRFVVYARRVYISTPWITSIAVNTTQITNHSRSPIDILRRRDTESEQKKNNVSGNIINVFFLDRSEGCQTFWRVDWDCKISNLTYKTSWKI